jgi:hypothetical protein
MPLLNEKMSNGAVKIVDLILVWSATGAILLMGFLFVFPKYQHAAIFLGANGQFQNFKETTVSIDYGNGKIRTFKGPLEENSKVWDAFQQAIVAGGINIEIVDNFVPRSIDGFENGAGGKHWNLYVNNVKQKFSPFEIQIKPGDKVVFKFE